MQRLKSIEPNSVITSGFSVLPGTKLSSVIAVYKKGKIFNNQSPIEHQKEKKKGALSLKSGIERIQVLSKFLGKQI